MIQASLSKTVFGIASVVLLAGCVTGNLSSSLPSTQEIPSLDGPGLGSVQIAKALEDGSPLSCEIVKTDENKHLTLHLKEKKVWLTGNTLTPTGEDATLIYDPDYVYLWENGATLGMKSKLPSSDDIAVVLDEAKAKGLNIPDPTNPNSFSIFEAKGYIISCEDSESSDGTFVPPTTVSFTDMTETIQNTINRLKQRTPSPSPEIVL